MSETTRGELDATCRCVWSGAAPEMIAYHDQEWGVPSHDDRHLFELLTLEGAQAGLSWSTILGKRQGYRRLFADFDPEAVARFDHEKIAELLADSSIVRNRLKVASAITNARAVLALREEFGSLHQFLWSCIEGAPLQHARQTAAEIPAVIPAAQALSSELKRRGFRFVGPTICYAFMQAAGMVNDHTVDCFRWRELGGEERRRKRESLPGDIPGTA